MITDSENTYTQSVGNSFTREAFGQQPQNINLPTAQSCYCLCRVSSAMSCTGVLLTLAQRDITNSQDAQGMI